MRRFRYGKAEDKNRIGQVTGLAWTEVGGELLTIEAAIVPGKGKLQHTGQLGEVMQESIQAAMTVVRSRAQVLGLEPDFYQKNDVHLHMPEGATPKDGPSAGIGMCTALVSALTGIPVRSDVAMTGEITLRGEVLPIGGLKEKLLAAHRGGIKTVLIPDENEKDLAEIPDNIKGNLEIKPVKWIDEVLQVALTHQPTPTAGGAEGREAGSPCRPPRREGHGSGALSKSKPAAKSALSPPGIGPMFFREKRRAIERPSSFVPEKSELRWCERAPRLVRPAHRALSVSVARGRFPMSRQVLRAMLAMKLTAARIRKTKNSTFAMPHRAGGDSTEAEHRRDQRDDEKYDCVVKHFCPLRRSPVPRFDLGAMLPGAPWRNCRRSARCAVGQKRTGVG